MIFIVLYLKIFSKNIYFLNLTHKIIFNSYIILLQWMVLNNLILFSSFLLISFNFINLILSSLLLLYEIFDKLKKIISIIFTVTDFFH